MRGWKPDLAWVPVGLAITAVLLATGCTSSPAAPPSGNQAAQHTRIAVAQEYWKVLAVIAPEIFSRGSGSGYFSACSTATGHVADQVTYNVENNLLSLRGRLKPDTFTAKLAQLLQTHGWSAFTASNGSAVSTQAGYQLTLQPVSGSAEISAKMTLTGPCVSVTTAFASAAPQMTLNDDYPNSQVPESPTPTAPLPSP
jgi:hypothetical protein